MPTLHIELLSSDVPLPLLYIFWSFRGATRNEDDTSWLHICWMSGRLSSGVAKAGPGRARARPKAPFSSRSCHAISCEAHASDSQVPGQYEWPGYATVSKSKHRYYKMCRDPALLPVVVASWTTQFRFRVLHMPLCQLVMSRIMTNAHFCYHAQIYLVLPSVDNGTYLPQESHVAKLQG